MCLIALAHRALARFPLIIAANRDEDYERPSIAANFWPDAPHILGGRDALLGGSWLAMTRSGRFAAVTNLRGSEKAAHHRSRGALVRDFVAGESTARDFAAHVVDHIGEYTGFHLLVGDADEIVLVSGDARVLTPGLYAISNAPRDEQWPKVDAAIEALRGQDWLHSTDVADSMLQFLQSGGTGDATRDAFIEGERYGTRCSTVIVVSADEVLFVEQGYRPATRSLFRFERQ